jgi:hypothetical protein
VFDLEKMPLVKFKLLRLRDGEHWLVRVGHHILHDGWSWQLYFRELALLYEAGLQGEQRPLPCSEELQYVDYAAWQRATLCHEGLAYREAVSWWRERFADPPSPIELPFKRAIPRPDVDPAEGVIHWSVDLETACRLDVLGRAQSTTPYTIHFAALAALLADEADAADLVIGTYVTNRRRIELQRMFGYFSSLVTLRLAFSRKFRFTDWLSIVQGHLADTEGHAEIPYEEIGMGLKSCGVNLPEVRIIIFPRTNQNLRFADLELIWLEQARGTMPWGFSVSIDTARHEGIAEFDAGVYDPSGVRALLDRYIGLLDALSRYPHLSVGRATRNERGQRLDTEMQTLRTALATSEQDRADRLDAIKRLDTEVQTLRTALATSEQDRADRLDAIKRLRARIDLLQAEIEARKWRAWASRPVVLIRALLGK